eukprot:6151376-Alexandrium_andersonii.AAC.1
MRQQGLLQGEACSENCKPRPRLRIQQREAAGRARRSAKYFSPRPELPGNRHPHDPVPGAGG